MRFGQRKEIGKLWEDINKPPYILLFNKNIVSLAKRSFAKKGGLPSRSLGTRKRETEMAWYCFVLEFVSGLFLANGVPHFVQGVCGHRFQSPFASPPGVGESSPLSNALWGFMKFCGSLRPSLVLRTARFCRRNWLDPGGLRRLGRRSLAIHLFRHVALQDPLACD